MGFNPEIRDFNLCPNVKEETFSLIKEWDLTNLAELVQTPADDLFSHDPD